MKKQPIYENWTLEECESYCRKRGITLAQLFCDPEKEMVVQLSEKERKFLSQFFALKKENQELIAELVDYIFKNQKNK